MSQPFWLLAPVRPHGQTYLSKLSPLGEGFVGASQRGQSIRLTPRWEYGGLRLHFLSAPPGCLQLMGWLSPQLSWFWSPVRSSVGAKPRKSPAKPTELCPGLSPCGWQRCQTHHSLHSLSLQLCGLPCCKPFTDCGFPVTLVGTHSSLAREERGAKSARLPVLCPQAVRCHRCHCCAGPPAGVVFRKLVSFVFGVYRCRVCVKNKCVKRIFWCKKSSP